MCLQELNIDKLWGYPLEDIKSCRTKYRYGSALGVLAGCGVVLGMTVWGHHNAYGVLWYILAMVMAELPEVVVQWHMSHKYSGMYRASFLLKKKVISQGYDITADAFTGEVDALEASGVVGMQEAEELTSRLVNYKGNGSIKGYLVRDRKKDYLVYSSIDNALSEMEERGNDICS